MTYKERSELNQLSKLVFGKSSKWQKLVDKGAPEVYERQRQVMVPDGRGGAKEKVFTDKKTVMKRYEVAEIKKFMEDELLKRVGKTPEIPYVNLPVTPLPEGSVVQVNDTSTSN